MFEGYESLDEIEKLQILYLRTYLPSLFIAQDKMEMAHSTEVRVPLCDNELIEFSLSVPVEQKLKDNELKSIIKNSMKGIIPDILYQQEKRGFPTPLGPWLKKGLNEYFEKSFNAVSRRLSRISRLSPLLEALLTIVINRLVILEVQQPVVLRRLVIFAPVVTVFTADLRAALIDATSPVR